MLNANPPKRGALNSSVLVLNRVYLPVHVTTVRRAFSMIYQGTAKAVDDRYQTFDFESWRIRVSAPHADTVGTTSGYVPVPRVIVLAHFDRMPRRHVRFSRGNIFSRDRYTCQYCGASPARNELNLDHVVPRSLGGRTSWENVVCCCVPCNRRKGGRTPEQARMNLQRRPARPRWTPLMNLVTGAARYHEWRPFLSTGEASFAKAEYAS
jgi:5-methylcytosine-specific restriction endonuclease McrA